MLTGLHMTITATSDLLTAMLITDTTPRPLVGTEFSELPAALIFEVAQSVNQLKDGRSNPFRNLCNYILVCTLLYAHRLESSTRQR